MIKAIGFDMGGVIIIYSIPHQVDVISALLGVSREAVDQAYHDLRPELDVASISNQDFWAKLIKIVGSKADATNTEHIWSDNYIRDNPFIDGMLDLVDRLKQAGYKVGLLSNIDYEHAEINRGRHIYDHFDEVLLSDEIHARKPDPGAYQRLADSLQAQPEELVFIDDLPENVAGAEAFGAHGIHFTSYSELVKALRALGVKV